MSKTDTKARHERLLNVCRNARNQNQAAKALEKNNDKIAVTIPRFWQMTARDYHEFKNMAYYYKEAGLKVKYEEVGCSGDYYAIFWIGKKPIEEINATKATFENYE